MQAPKAQLKGFYLTADTIRMLDELINEVGQGNQSATVRHCIYQEYLRVNKRKKK